MYSVEVPAAAPYGPPLHNQAAVFLWSWPVVDPSIVYDRRQFCLNQIALNPDLV